MHVDTHNGAGAILLGGGIRGDFPPFLHPWIRRGGIKIFHTPLHALEGESENFMPSHCNAFHISESLYFIYVYNICTLYISRYRHIYIMYLQYIPM